jgi:signal transduction histidine kinase/CheY-like chemotaxis protein
MSKNIVAKLAFLVALSMVVLGASLALIARRGVEDVSRSMELATTNILEGDLRSKVEDHELAAGDYGKAMAGYLAWISIAPLWDFNYKVLEDYAEGMTKVPNISSAVIYREDGSLAAGRSLSHDAAHSHAEDRVFTSDIVRNGERIGSVEVRLTCDHLDDLRIESEKNLREILASYRTSASEAEESVTSRMLLLSLLALSVVLAVNTYFIFRTISPLRTMTRALLNLGETNTATGTVISDTAPHTIPDNSLQLLSEKLSRLKEEVVIPGFPHRKDELGVLSSALSEMSTLLQSRIRIQWGISDILNVAAVSRTKEDFAWNFLRLVMNETNSCMSAFYIRNESEPHKMDLVASVGMPSDAPSSIRTAGLEGQFGVPIFENAVRTLDIPPASSPRFETIGGKILPAQIITLPLSIRDEIVALFTMASLTPYPPVYGQIFSMVRDGLNAAFANLLAGERERELVQDLQGANQELASQSEELECQAMELEQQNTEVNIQRKRAEEASRLKTQFLSNMSHELRTPLNSILALSRVLRTEGQERLLGEELEYLDIIERNGKNLLELINGILDLSRIEAGRDELNLKEIEPGHILLNVVENLSPLASEKGISLDYSAPRNIPPLICDEEKLYRILLNIAGNAVKFTSEGGVTISARLEENCLAIVVEDTGIGIAPDELPFIFDEFRQSDGSMARRFEGTGLGLAIVKKYAEILEIDVAVESTPGKGSVFTVRIPLLPGASAPMEECVRNDAAARTARENTQIFLLEDNPVTAMQIRRTLEQNGFSVVVFPGGREALEAIGDLKPHAIVLDLMMPGMNGFEFLEELRSRRIGIPVLVLTAKVLTPKDAKALNEHGIRYLALKGDLNSRDLVSKIRAMLSQEEEN